MSYEVIVRFVVKDDKAVTDALKNQKGASAELVKAIQEASKSINGQMVLPLKEARQLLVQSGGDTKKFEQAMRQAGIPIRDAKLMAQDLNKWMDNSRKTILGIGTASRSFAEQLRNGVFAAEAMTRVFDKGKQKLQELAKIAHIKGFEESTQDAAELDKQLNKLRAKLSLINDEKGFAAAKETIQSVALQAGVPQTVAIEAVLGAQEKKSMGREVLAKNGAMLRQLLVAGTGDYLDNEEISSSVESQITTMRDLGLTSAEDVTAMQGITRAGEEKGSLSAKNIQTKGGGVIAQLMGMQNTSGLVAYRKGQALLQAMADDPKLRGDIDLTVNRAENMLSKFADEKTRERFKETYGFDPMRVDKRTGAASLRDPDEIASGIRRAETEGKLRLANQSDPLSKAKAGGRKVGRIKLYEVVKDMQAREGVMSILRNPERIKELENVDPKLGQSFLDEGFDFRMGTYEGQTKARLSRAEVFGYQNFMKHRHKIQAASEIMQEAQNQTPGAASVVNVAGDLAGRWTGDKGKAIVEGFGLSAIGLYANYKRKQTSEISTEAEIRKDMERKKQSSEENLQKLQQQRDELQRKLEVNVNVTLQNGQKASVTAEARSPQQAARGGKRVPVKPGQH